MSIYGIRVAEDAARLMQARSILRGDGGDRSDRDTLKALWRLLLPDECGRRVGTEEAASEVSAAVGRFPSPPAQEETP